MRRNGGSRRPRLVRLALVGLLAAAATALAVSARREGLAMPAIAPGSRNVLLITIDTLRADALGLSGGEAATPNLDALARSGVAFDFAHAHAVVTLPSHASILTGLYPFAHGIRDNAGYRLPEGTQTLATFLKGHDYATGAFVGAFPLDARFGLGAGFDVYDDRYPSRARASDLLMPERPADQVVAAATAWIRRQPGRWFAWVHLFDPHAPYRAPPPYRERYAANPYAGEVSWVDHALGPLLEVARKASLPALVVVTSDHGESLGAHGEATHGLFAYEETLRVPLIVAATDVAPASLPGRSSWPARHVDVVPTIAASLGLPLPPGLPGEPLLSPSRRRPEDVSSYFESLSASLNRGWAPLTGVMLGRRKYVDLPIPELYDLATDPREQQNRHEEWRSQARVLASLLESLPRDAEQNFRRSEDLQTRRSLEALGYVSSPAARPAQYGEDDDPKRLVALDQAIQQGIESYQRGDVEGAVRLYASVIRQRPRMATPYLHIAFAAWEAGRPREAIDTLRSALAANADTAELRAQLGIYLAEAGSAEEAALALREALARDPDDLDALNGLGIALFRSGRVEEAGRTFRSILERDPTNAQALQNSGTIALSGNALPAAREAFTAALALDPEMPTALNGLGVVASQLGQDNEAIDLWRRAVAGDPRQFDALYNLAATLMKKGRQAEARPYLEQFLRTAPPSFYAEDLKRVGKWLATQ